MPLGPGPEFDRIRRFAALLGEQAGGLGDDCAVVHWPGGELVLSTDLSIEGVHFQPAWLTPWEIGWRAAAAALSDLAAEGARPLGLLNSIGVPPVLDQSVLDQVMSGIGQAGASVGATVLGGDLSRADRLIIDVTVVGSATRPVTRAGAAAGQSLWVSGSLGGARAALRAWQAGLEPEPGARARFARPEPRVNLGEALAAEGATAMIDLSDGLAGDATHLAAASEVAVEIDLDLLPLGPGVGEAANRVGVHPAVFAAEGGEDYELLVAMPEGFSQRAAERLGQEGGAPLRRIGRVIEGQGASLRLGGVPQALRGYDHFG